MSHKTKQSRHKADQNGSTSHSTNHATNINNTCHENESDVDPEFQEQARRMLEKHLDQTIQYDLNVRAHTSDTSDTSNNNTSTTRNGGKDEGIYLLTTSKQCAVLNEFRDGDAPMLMTKRAASSDSDSDSDSDSEDERIRSVAVQFNPSSGGFDAKTDNSTKNKR